MTFGLRFVTSVGFALLVLGCDSTGIVLEHVDAGTDAVVLDATVLDASDPTECFLGGLVTCDRSSQSESPSTTPTGDGLLSYSVTSGRVLLCGPATIRMCGDNGCTDLAHPGGLVEVFCEERSTYTVNGAERWTRIESYVVEVLP